MKIDKFLANTGVETCNEVRQLFKEGLMNVNEQVIKSPKIHIESENDKIPVRGESIGYVRNVYIILNKPKGYISATEDHHSKTVIDLIPEYQHLNIFPVGRLDKDVEGLLLITNDGGFNHELISPNRHVSKKYEVISVNPIAEEGTQAFEEGITLSDGKVKPAVLTYTDNQALHVAIYEGKYHQVERMFHSIQNEVLHLRRIKVADLELDSSLDPGEYCLLTENNLDKLNYK